jgi:hypothetical protein
MQGSNIPYFYHDGDYISAEKENKNHQYLQTIILKQHNHSIYGEGSELVNPINTGVFTTDYFVSRSGVYMETFLGQTISGGYMYSSTHISGGKWTDYVSPTTFYHEQDKYPYIVQIHFATSGNYSGSCNPPKAITPIYLDCYNTNGEGFVAYGAFAYDINKDSVTIKNVAYAADTGTPEHNLGSTILVRAICIF